MSTTPTGARRRRALAELGLTRWQLRSSISSKDVFAASASADPVVTKAVMRVWAPDGDDMPTTGIAAKIWPQVLAWLGYREDEVAWLPVETDAVVLLPPVADWSSAAGKRALWLALKRHARGPG